MVVKWLHQLFVVVRFYGYVKVKPHNDYLRNVSRQSCFISQVPTASKHQVHHYFCKQEAQLSQRNHVMHYVTTFVLVSRAMGVIEVSNSKSDCQGH